MNREYMRIGEVAKLVGISTRELRQWEREFPIRPLKRKGYRLYSKRDVELILRIKKLLDRGMTPDAVKKRLEEGLSEEERGFLKLLRGIKEEIKRILEYMDASERDRDKKGI